MNYRLSYLLPLFLFLSLNMFGQTISNSMEGVVMNEDGTPVDGAVVSIMYAKDSSIFKVLVTESTGDFAVDHLKPERYLLYITNMGYQNYWSAAFMIDSATMLKLPAIPLKITDNQLGTVTIEARKNLVERKIDRTVINVNSFIGNAGNNVLEVLQKSPGVSVDANDNIQLKGKSGVVIFIDDKPTYLSQQDLANYLRSLPSSSVDVIELMTNPPAKYDAAGNAGIINIRLKKSKAQGFNGGFNLSYGQGFYARTSNSLNFNYRVNKVNFFSNVSYNISNNYQDLFIERNYYKPTGEPLSMFNQHSYIKRNNKGANLRLGMDYYISKKSTFGIMFSGFRNVDNSPVNNTASIFDSTGTVTNNVKAYALADKVLKNKSVNLNYNYKIDSSGREILVNLDYLDYDGTLNSSLLNSIYMPDGTFLSKTNLIGNLPSNIKIATAKVDYTHPLKSLGTFGIGAKTSFIKTNNVANFYDEENSELTVNNDFSNNFTYKENINAAYVNYSFEKGRFSMQAGLRFENTIINGQQLGNAIRPDSSYDRTMNNLFPTFYLNYKFDSLDNNQIGFSYGRRIDRPNYQDMNPFTYPLDRYTLYGGNPFLRPTISNNFELSHTFKNKITTAFQLNYTKDLISETIEQSNGIFFSRPGNLGEQLSYGLTMNINVNPMKWWTLQVYTELLNDNFKATLYNETINNSGVHWAVNATNQFQLNKAWTAEVSGSYQTKAYYAQFIVIPSGSISVGVAKKILKDKATIKANLNDPFYLYKAGGSIIGLSNSDALWRSRFDSRVLTLSFSYRFNKGQSLKARSSGGSDSEKGRVS
jgi:iron complex outermembrane receptor protein